MGELILDVEGELPDDFMIDKVIVIIEGINAGDDDTVLWTTTSRGLKSWQTLGMLAACHANEAAQLVGEFQDEP
ncbi:MAG TPA: hypothetical protein VNJ54_11415 [Plantibacter sp.]|uniref:hypothetical protein n=1 Tax=Plantibacter sp. TaxID=1871045 RepID=UPI002CFE7384|nr:hypothetical protein [Plantibacter sp.]